MRGATSAVGFVTDVVGALLAVAAILIVVGASLHAAGHALVATLNGARVVRVNVLGLELAPRFAWAPRSGVYGFVHQEGDLTFTQASAVQAAGSATTLLVSLAAAATYRMRPRLARRGLRLVRLGLLCLWADAVFHTLPSVGVGVHAWLGMGRRAHPFGELVAGATGLGLPPVLVYAFVFASPLLAFVIAGRRARRT